MTEPKQLVQKLWNYCDILRDDGLSYGDYVEQLTYLLFLKMDDERTKEPYNKKSDIPKKYKPETAKRTPNGSGKITRVKYILNGKNR